jgi:hypothetical protein
MSTTINYDYNPNQQLSEEDIRRIAREESQRGKTEVWTNPVTGNQHAVRKGLVPYGARNVDDGVIQDLWRNSPVIANVFRTREGAKRLAAGTLNADSAQYMPYTEEFQDAALRFYELKEKIANGEIGHRESAGAIANSDYLTIAEQVISNELYDKTVVEYVLEQAVTNKTSDVLKVALPGTVGAAKPWSKGLGEFDTPDPHNIVYTTAEMSLKKMAARFEISTWFDLTARRFNVEADTKAQIERDRPRVFDEEIRDRLVEFPNIAAGTAWTAKTSGVSDVDPTVKIEEALGNIATDGGRANVAVMHTSTFNAMVGNTFMRSAGLVNLQTTEPATSADLFGATRRHEKLPDLTIYTSRNVTVGSMYIFDKRAIDLVKGPSRVGNYEDILGSYRGTLFEQWYGSVVVDSTWGEEITGINS